MADLPVGTPTWVDLGTPDVDAAADFYRGLFGWEAEEAGPADETGGYRMFRSNGKVVAGVGQLPADGQRPVWTAYISTDDADETARRIEEAGGTLIMSPFDVMDAGRMAIALDPNG